MKVALISFHNAYNYGAALQAYALQEAIKSLGIDCEYINYINDHRRNSYDMRFLFWDSLKKHDYKYAIRALAGTPFMMLRSFRFNEFYEKYLQKTHDIYRSSDEAKVLNDHYDKFVVGSDQVWNPENNGCDFAYLLDFVEDSRKCISYSPSFGLSEIPEELWNNYERCLKKFKYLGVRERRGQELVKRVTGRNAALLLDPVFLLDRGQWEQHIETVTEKEFVFFYTNDNDEIKDFLSTGYDMKGLKYHILSTKITPFDILNPKKKITVSMRIERFLGEIDNAKLVVTSSFHCLAFAIIFHKPFVAILTGNTGKDERLVSLLETCGLSNRILSADTSVADINSEIDYDAVYERLNRSISFARQYLLNAIHDDLIPDPIEDKLKIARFCTDNRCTGCTACVSICPTRAISMRDNDEGFKTPFVNEELCIKCGKCHSACQVYSLYNRSPEKQEFWAVKNTDDIRMHSSSGGVFPGIANKIIQENGVVFAAKMTNYHVQHAKAKSCQDIVEMANTYYVQSDLGETYSNVSEELIKGKKVLFVGTPCQVAGLKLFLQKEYENLYTVDLICHGVPSPRIFKSFIESLQSKGQLNQYRFRDKTIGWEGYTETANINGRRIYKKSWLCSFTNLFSHNMINRMCCSECKFSNLNRCSDITIGDFWGVDKFDKSLNDGKGVSLVIVNTSKGKEIINKCETLSCIPISCKEAMQNSLKRPAKPSKYRMRAFRLYKNSGYDAVAKKYGDDNLFGQIKYFLEKIRNTRRGFSK